MNENTWGVNSENLSLSARAIFVKSEGGSMKFTDMNRIDGAASFDGMGTFAWLHEYVADASVRLYIFISQALTVHLERADRMILAISLMHVKAACSLLLHCGIARVENGYYGICATC